MYIYPRNRSLNSPEALYRSTFYRPRITYCSGPSVFPVVPAGVKHETLPKCHGPRFRQNTTPPLVPNVVCTTNAERSTPHIVGFVSFTVCTRRLDENRTEKRSERVGIVYGPRARVIREQKNKIRRETRRIETYPVWAIPSAISIPVVRLDATITPVGYEQETRAYLLLGAGALRKTSRRRS